MKLPDTWLRRVSWLEGLSFIVLLGVAMPLKYAADKPDSVKIVGWIHGALFMIICVMTLVVMRRRKWSLGRGAMVVVAALIPLGPFIFDSKIASWESEQVTSQ